MINFSMNAYDEPLITQVADRAAALEARHGVPSARRRKHLDWVMDLATLQNTVPVDLDRLLAADDFNFAHDVFGIARHLDRDDNSPSAGYLKDCFRPRFAR